MSQIHLHQPGNANNNLPNNGNLVRFFHFSTQVGFSISRTAFRQITVGTVCSQFPLIEQEEARRGKKSPS